VYDCHERGRYLNFSVEAACMHASKHRTDSAGTLCKPNSVKSAHITGQICNESRMASTFNKKRHS
jgi:hypothetical protein